MAKLSLPLDREALLEPISDSQPSGESLRYEGTYDRIKEARREEDPDLPQGVWKRELKVADMDTVAGLCLEAIEARSKDLQLAAWLTEALTVLYATAGCAEGIGLTADLCERFWDTIHPHMEDGDSEFRTAPIEWLDGILVLRLRQVKISQPSARDSAQYCYGDWEDVMRHEAHPQDSVPEDAPSKADITTSWSLTPDSFFHAELERLARLTTELERLVEVLRERLGDDAPSLRRTREMVPAMQRTFERALPAGQAQLPPAAAVAAEPQPDTEADEESPQQTPVSRPQPTPAAPAGAITSRAEAYARLREVADYLLRTEPHSPAGYLAKRAVAWGEMTLADVLAEIVASSSDLQTIYTLLGITPRTPPTGDDSE